MVVPGPGPGTVGMPGATARFDGAAGAAGIGTNRGLAAWGTPPFADFSPAASPAAAGEAPVVPGAAGTAPPLVGAAGGVAEVAGAEPACPPCARCESGIGRNDGVGVSEGGATGWSEGDCCNGVE